MASGTPGPGRDRPTAQMSAAKREVERMAATIAHDVAALENKTIKSLLPTLLEARDDLHRDLNAWLRTKDGATKFTAQDLRRGLVSIEAALTTIGQMRGDLQTQITAATTTGASLASEHLREQLARFGAIFGESIRPTQISTAAIMAKVKHEIIPQIRTSAARYVPAVREDMRHQLQLGLVRGETFTQMTNRLRRLGGPSGLVSLRGVAGEPGSYVEDIAEGLFNRYRHWAERVVRTEVINAYNVEHIAAIDIANEDRDEGDEQLRLRWDSSPDRRRCPICKELDGELAPVGKRFRGGYDHPPAHPNCRCVVLAWLARWGDIKGELEAAREPKRPHKKIEQTLPTPIIRAKREPAKRQRDTDTRRAIDAMAKDRIGDARQAIDDAFRARGLVPQPSTTPQAPTEVTKLPPGVLGLHQWDGRIKIAPAVARAAQEFAEAFAKDAKSVKAKLKALHAARVQTGVSRPHGHDEALALERQAGRGFHVIAHESAHGFGPVHREQYRGIGAKVEEVTTETAARQYMREKFGLVTRSFRFGGKKGALVRSDGAYEGEILATIEGIKKAFKVGDGTAYKLLEQASSHFRKQPKTAALKDALLPIEHLAHSLATVRPSRDASRNQPKRSLMRSDGTPASEHEYAVMRTLTQMLTP